MALPLKKRAYRGNDYSIAKRLKRVERRTAMYRPEMKSHNYSVVTQNVSASGFYAQRLISIVQGVSGDERIGQKAKLFRLEVRGMADPGLDLYLIQSKHASAPVAGDFTTGVGGYIKDGNTNFVEWRYIRPKPDQTTNSPFRITQSFKNGYNLEYTDDTTSFLLKNDMYIVVRNDTAASQTITYSVKMWFTDA